METHPRISRIQLQIELGGLDGLFFFAREFGKAIGEGICDTKFHLIILKLPCHHIAASRRELALAHHATVPLLHLDTILR